MTSAPSERQQQLERTFASVAHTGVYHLPAGGATEIIAAAETCGFQVFRVDLSRARDKEGLLAAVGRDMAFPEWFGANWDALADHLGDLGWRPAEGYLVILEHSDRINARGHDDFITALQIFSAAAEEWRERNIAFWCLVDMQADGIACLPGL